MGTNKYTLRDLKIIREEESPRQLNIYKINGNLYFLDKRLNEYRNIKNPFDVLEFEAVSLEELEAPTEKDRENIFIELKGGIKE